MVRTVVIRKAVVRTFLWKKKEGEGRLGERMASK